MLCIFHVPRCTSKLREKPRVLQNNSKHFNTGTFLIFNLNKWAIFAFLDPDPDPRAHSNQDSGHNTGF